MGDNGNTIQTCLLDSHLTDKTGWWSQWKKEWEDQALVAFLEGLCDNAGFPHVHRDTDLPTTPGFQFKIHDPKIHPLSQPPRRRLVQQDQGYLPLSAIALLPLGIALGYLARRFLCVRKKPRKR